MHDSMNEFAMSFTSKEIIQEELNLSFFRKVVSLSFTVMLTNFRTVKKLQCLIYES